MNNKYIRFAAAAVIYVVFAGYLYRPYFNGFNSLGFQDLFVANVCLASLGCYVLSRRWVGGFAESFFAGAVYGFGPYMLGLIKFHPTGGFLVAAIPWLFCPTVYGPKGKYKPLRILLAFLPFVVIVLFFQVAAHFGLYPVPINLKLHAADLAGLLAPLIAAKRGMPQWDMAHDVAYATVAPRGVPTLVGFYHVPIVALVMGFCMFTAPLKGLTKVGVLHKGTLHQVRYRGKFLKDLTVRRFGIVAVFAIATILSFCDSLLQVSPIILAAISTLYCSVLIGVGMQGLIGAGPADRKPVLFAAIFSGVLAINSYCVLRPPLAGHNAELRTILVETAKMHLLAASAVAILFIIARAKLRIHPARQILLYAAMALDIFLGARFIVDTIL